MATSLEQRRTAALDASTSSTVLGELAADADVVVRRRVATAQNLDSAAVARLARDDDSIVREKIALRDDLEPAIRADLVADARWHVREAARGPSAIAPAAAETMGTVDDLATRLAAATDSDRAVRLDVARTSDALADPVLAALAQDDDALVRHAVAVRDQQLPAEVVAWLIDDIDWPVRMALAARPDLTQVQRDGLAKDPHEKVRAALETNPS